MESRNTTLTTCGECVNSPQDRKAVNQLEDLLGQVEAPTSICFPLYNLIPEIISDENMERSFSSNRTFMELKFWVALLERSKFAF